MDTVMRPKQVIYLLTYLHDQKKKKKKKKTWTTITEAT